MVIQNDYYLWLTNHFYMVKPEYSFERDYSFSLWHRKLSNHWWMLDMDNLLWCVAGKDCQPLAIIEEKKAGIQKLDLSSFQFQTLRNLAKDLPVFCLLVHYNEIEKYHSFYLMAANQPAEDFMMKAIGKKRTYLTEQGYLTFEAYLRVEPPPLTKMDKACILLDKFELPKIINY